jgi:tetratricopeptide (TPR) repeat protein
MVKPMLVTLPFVLLLLDWWPLGRLHPSPGAPPHTPRRGRLLLEKVPLLLLSAASSVVTFVAQQRGGTMAESSVFPLMVRLSNACVSYVSYLGKTIWPRDLIPFYPHPGFALTSAEVALAIALLTGLTATAVATRWRSPWLVIGWLWYLGMLIPVIGLVQVGLQGMADRYTYLPLIGPFVALCWEIRSWAERSTRGRCLAGTVAACALASLAFLTWHQSHYWKSTDTLFSHVAAVDPNNYLAFSVLGSEQLRHGEPSRAMTLLNKSLAIKPGYLPARYNLGLALAASGGKQAAIAQFSGLILANPTDAESLYNRGKLLLATGRPKEALQDFDGALAVSREHAQIHFSRGLALARLGRHEESAAAFREAAAIEPRSAETYYNLGQALDAAGRLPEAESNYRVALSLEPAFSEAHNMLGVVIAKQGRLLEATGHFREAVRLDPSNAGARANLDRAGATSESGL